MDCPQGQFRDDCTAGARRVANVQNRDGHLDLSANNRGFGGRHDDAGETQLVHEDAVLPWPECGEPPCWRRERDGGFSYRRGETDMPGAIDQLLLPSKKTEKPQLYVRGTGPRGFDEIGKTMTVQLIARDGGHPRCWSATHSRVTRGVANCPDPRAARLER
jgi:hypothetical protein